MKDVLDDDEGPADGCFSRMVKMMGLGYLPFIIIDKFYPAANLTCARGCKHISTDGSSEDTLAYCL